MDNIKEQGRKHKFNCKCLLCSESLVMNKLLKGKTMSVIIREYFEYVCRSQESRIAINNTFLFDYKESNEFNLEVLFRKLERRHIILEGDEKRKDWGIYMKEGLINHSERGEEQLKYVKPGVTQRTIFVIYINLTGVVVYIYIYILFFLK